MSQRYSGRPGRTPGQGTGSPVSDSNSASQPSGRNVHDTATDPRNVTMSAMPTTVRPHH